MRGQFHFHSDYYYLTMLSVLGAADQLTLAVAEHDGDVLAVHMLIHFGDTMTYAHGASTSMKRELMAPHLLQWESIKWTRAQGYTKYDFYGVAPKDAAADHPWAGITRFKMGFGGHRVMYPAVCDYVLNPLSYWVYNRVRALKK